ncbi:putative membrane protein [Mycolicibacterium hassiacum DSM 44199]|uniref:Putative membrane protein n=2 Tax=Mycolicibacterium hassiacum TaxID=46351 RepID=K5BAP7_MYCHD|nr:putative membrane protein [Mycolicibacterium hassiacum DSM 44199]MDA4088786.1 membrane protein [Mycolicibacterium hassiacum DSM 44199]PZN20520.1 MAG: hypothetical protein DIU75_12275 [Mycolicibacterium hassiacum]
MSIWQRAVARVEAMTASATARPTTGPLPTTGDALLRFALRVDATVCAGVGLIVAMAADPLSGLSGLTATQEWVAGAALVGYGTLLHTLAGRSEVRRVGVGVLVGNLAFVAATAAALATDLLPLTGFGVAAALAFDAVTALIAVVQYLGVRRLA